MKKYIALALAIFASTSVFAQGAKGTWNQKTCTYTNTTHGITWTLPTEIGWKKVDATGPNICFKALDPETGLMLILNVKTDQAYGTDIWPSYPDMSSKEYKDYVIKGARSAGVTIKSMDVVKSQLDGVHALKTTTLMKKNDPAFGGVVDIYDITYTFILNNKLYSADMQALKELKDEVEGFDQAINMIFKGIKITR